MINAVSRLNNRAPGSDCLIADYGKLVGIIRKYVVNYQREVEGLANAINKVSNYVPRRRARKLHIGLFGYSRGFRGRSPSQGNHIRRSALFPGYTARGVGGVSTINELSDAEYAALSEAYVNLRHDLSVAARYVCHECLDMLTKLGNAFGITNDVIHMVRKDIETLEEMGIRAGGPSDYESRKHELLAQLLINSLAEGREDDTVKYMVEMALIRHAIG